MFNHIKEDNTFHEIRSKSVHQWLDAMGNHEDPEVRGGVKATMEHMAYLLNEIAKLEQQNGLKDAYLKKISSRAQA